MKTPNNNAPASAQDHLGVLESSDSQAFSENPRMSASAATIVAISTPTGVGGIAVLRLSGPQSWQIASRHLSLPQDGSTLPALRYSLFRDGDNVLDEVVAAYYRAPHSYTGEDVVEISCHGSAYVQQALLSALIGSGAMLAQPGEYTQRAFLNGRLDLSQAEAVADLIDSTNAGSHALAVSQLRGGYAKRLAALRDQFVQLASLLELELDFSDEDVEFADRTQLLSILDRVEEECRRLCDSFRLGNAVKNGVPVAIVGRPNVGKSTLLNALVGEERAIVSDIAGTTRDTIEDTLTFSGITFRIVDTAGIRHSDDKIESLGIERSYRAVEQAQVVLYLVDASQVASARQELDDLRSHVDLADKHILLLLNKSDLHTAEKVVGESRGEDIEVRVSEVMGMQTTTPAPSPKFSIPISAKTGEGLDRLRDSLAQIFTAPDASQLADNPVLSNVRHYDALQRVLEATAQVRQGLLHGLPSDLVVIDLRDALYHLGTITGQVTSNEVLGSIFSRFCIGK